MVIILKTSCLAVLVFPFDSFFQSSYKAQTKQHSKRCQSTGRKLIPDDDVIFLNICGVDDPTMQLKNVNYFKSNLFFTGWVDCFKTSIFNAKDKYYLTKFKLKDYLKWGTKQKVKFANNACVCIFFSHEYQNDYFVNYN